MRAGLVAILVLVVVVLLAFGYTCQRSQYADTDEERVTCQSWGGGMLLVLVVLMTAAIAICFTSPGSTDGPGQPHEEYYYTSLRPLDAPDTTPASALADDVTALDHPGDMWA